MNVATDAQVKFINSLLLQKHTAGTIFDGHLVAPSGLDKSAASEAINALKALPNKAQSTVTIEYTTPIESGVYLYADTYYKVVKSPKTENFYCKAYDEAEGWVYAGKKPFAFIRPAHRLTAEDAAKFGHLYGSCVFCARTLTDERSIAVGYGQICANHNMLPWG